MAHAHHVLDLPGRGRCTSSCRIRQAITSYARFNGPRSFHLEMGVVAFTVIVFVLGFFMALGKAAVYKHIPVYYPKNVGSVGGLVGMIGGLGGFVLPIAFGALNDLTGLWTSCFMALFVLVSVALLWMHVADSLYGRRRRPARLSPSFHSFPEMQGITNRHVGAAVGRVLTDWRPEDNKFWDATGRAIARRTSGFRSRRFCFHSRFGRSGRWLSQNCRRSGSSSQRINCSGSQLCQEYPALYCASSIPSWCRFSEAACGRRLQPGL